MSDAFLSSEEYDERAHALYNEGRYDEALELLREGLALYPSAVELHVGVGYARLARDEIAWARRAFEEALTLDAEHEDALAGMGEVLLKLGRVDEAMRAFDTTVALGYDDDTDLMLQIGRALFREGYIEGALAYFERAVANTSDHAEAVACVGYAQHRLGRDADAITTLRRALALDDSFGEARVYLGNLLYDAGDMEGALQELERTAPADHWDELGIWRLLELRKASEALGTNDPALAPWESRLAELTVEPDAIDELLAEVEVHFAESQARDANTDVATANDATANDGTASDANAGDANVSERDGYDHTGTATTDGSADGESSEQLRTLGSLLRSLASERDVAPTIDDLLAMDAAMLTSPSSATRDAKRDASRDHGSRNSSRELRDETAHRVVLGDGRALEGTWEEIVGAWRDATDATRTVDEFMAKQARRHYGATGVQIATTGAEAFLRGSEDAGILRIVR